MDLSQILILECFSNLSPSKLFIFEEKIYGLSQFNFDDEGSTLIAKRIYDFLGFSKSHEINEEDFVCVLFTLNLEVHVNQWCHTLPSTIYFHPFI